MYTFKERASVGDDGMKDNFSYITFTLACKKVIFHFAHVTF
jgi:hypothetical protein